MTPVLGIDPGHTGGAVQGRLSVRQCGITAARVAVARLHRHLPRPPPSALVAFEVIGADRWPVGWALVGRPSSRALDARGWVEVTRCATDGTPNACSALYGAASRWARRDDRPAIVTYTLPSEGGASLRGAGWAVVGEVRPRRTGWADSRARTRGPVDGLAKLRWSPPWCADLVRLLEAP